MGRWWILAPGWPAGNDVTRDFFPARRVQESRIARQMTILNQIPASFAGG